MKVNTEFRVPRKAMLKTCIEWLQRKLLGKEIAPCLSETQTAWLATFLDEAYKDKLVGYLTSHAEVTVARQSDATIPPYVIRVVATGFWIDCLPAADEAVELAESLGLKVVRWSW